jgi:transketolase
MAGHLGLGKLICVYDDNRISIEGATDITFTEDVALRFKAYGWQVISVTDGNDVETIQAAVEVAKANTEQPSIIILRTFIAYGSPNKQGSADAHGAPLGVDEVKLTKRNLGCNEDECFCVLEDPLRIFRQCIDKGAEAEAEWKARFDTWREQYPGLARDWDEAMSGALPDGWDTALPDFPADGPPVATRAASGQVLNALAERIPTLMGGSADLAPSNKTLINSDHDFQKPGYNGRNIRFGVREHAMGAIMSGLALHGGIRPYGGTFLVFADYMRSTIRLASLMRIPLVYVFTHDSIAVGEDGPTHQPVEHLAGLRSIPGLVVLRPADAAETREAWRVAVTSQDTPVALILSRQKLPVLDRKKYAAADNLSRGAYILSDCEGTPEIILIATGSEVPLALAAQEKLAEKDVAARVVSMPSWELFQQAPPEYRDEVLPPTVPVRLSIEAGLPMGWERYTLRSDAIIGVEGFGASAPGPVLMEKYGFTVENVVRRAQALLGED